MTTGISRVFTPFPTWREILQPLISLYIEKEKEIFFSISYGTPPFFRWPPLRARGGGREGGYARNFQFPIFCVFFLYQPMCYSKTLGEKIRENTRNFRAIRSQPRTPSSMGGPGCDWQQTLMGDWHEEHPQ